MGKLAPSQGLEAKQKTWTRNKREDKHEGKEHANTKTRKHERDALLKTRAAKTAARNYFASFRSTCKKVDKLQGAHSGC